VPVTTYQAYNDYPYDNRDGKAFRISQLWREHRERCPNAVKVSFDRGPYSGMASATFTANSFLYLGLPAVRWLEKSGL